MTHPGAVVPVSSRRILLKSLAGAGLATLLPPTTSTAVDDRPLVPPPDGPFAMGLVSYCCNLRRRWMLDHEGVDIFEPAGFLEHCRSLGAEECRISLGVMSVADARALQTKAADMGMFIEAIISPPADDGDVDRFSQEMQTAFHTGAKAVRTVIIPGRRYERFQTLEEFQEYSTRGRKMLELAAPVAEHFELPLAVENHKDHLLEERLSLFEHIGSEYVGACVDTGNSFALLEDAVETVRGLAPWAHSVHLKDQAVEESADGFLLGDIPLGQGALDLVTMVEILQEAKPGICFNLELITRDPLRVPCLTDGYWNPFPARRDEDLARTMQFVRERSTGNLQYVTELSEEAQIALEDENVRASLEFSRERLLLIGP